MGSLQKVQMSPPPISPIFREVKQSLSLSQSLLNKKLKTIILLILYTIIHIVTLAVYPCLVLNHYFSLCQPMGSLTKVQMSPHPILPKFREEKQSYPFPNPSSIKSWKQSFYWRWKYEMLQAFLLKNITNMKSICYLIHTNVIIFHYKSFIFILKKLKFCKQTCLSC